MACCFKKNCENEVQYVCLCLCCETYCCEFHIETHLKLPNINHSFDAILAEPCEWTKAGILGFLIKEKLKKEKLKKIALASFTSNCYIPIEKSIKDVYADLKKINNLIENISKEEENILNESILISNIYIEKTPEPLKSVMLFCKSRELRNKKWAILNRVNNDLETEQDFRRTCTLYENLASHILLSQAYLEYINAYHKITSLYHIWYDNKGIPNLFTYSTETEIEDAKVFEFSTPLEMYYKNVIKSPNGDPFPISSGIPFRIDMSYQAWEMQTHMNIHAAIIFNRSVYYFGEKSDSNFSWRFDLNENRWSKFSAVPVNQFNICSGIIFNDNIIISGYEYSYLLLYSDDIDSFSEISYEFGREPNWKTLINAEERLYLMNCDLTGGIYESEVGNVYSWNRISFEVLFNYSQIYCSYNKGWIYISAISTENARDYFKFNLVSKKIIEVSCYRSHLALKNINGKLKAIVYYDQNFQLDPDLAAAYVDKGYNIRFLANCLEKIELCSIDIIDQGSNNSQSYYDKGVALHSIGRNLEAIECFNKAIKFNPELKNREIYLNIAETLHDFGTYLEEIKYYDKLIKHNPRDWEQYFRKGLSFHELGKYAEAIKWYNKALEYPDGKRYSEIYFRIGYSFYISGKGFEKALWCYNTAIKSAPHNSWYFFNRACIFNDLGNQEEALKDFNKAYDALNRKNLYSHSLNDKWLQYQIELLRAIANLQRKIVDIKDKLQKIKNENLEQYQEFKYKHSTFLKRAAKCLDEYKVRSFIAIEQTIKEVDEHQCALENVI